MRLTFMRKSTNLPLFCENIGYNWEQEIVDRPKGYYFFHWLQSEHGTGIVKVGHQEFTLAPGQGLLIRPNIAHHYQSYSPYDKWTTEFLVFSGTIVEELMDFVGLKDCLYVPKIHAKLVSFIKQHFNDFLKDDLSASLNQSAQIYKFIMLIKEENQGSFNSFDDQSITIPIIDYISRHYAKQLTNKELSAFTGYSVSYQNKIFKKHYGLTPLKYLEDYRLRKSKSLMMTRPDMQVQQISEAVGFLDVSRFIRRFKQSNGLTPKQFLKQK